MIVVDEKKNINLWKFSAKVGAAAIVSAGNAGNDTVEEVCTLLNALGPRILLVYHATVVNRQRMSHH